MISLWRKRLVGLAALLPLVLVVGVAAYKFGPSPARSTAAEPATNSPVAKPAPVDSNAATQSQVLELFGMYQTAVGKGRVELSVNDYLNSLEKLYRERGYVALQSLNEPHPKKTKRSRAHSQPGGPIKFFQRDETDGVASISATGEDADYNTAESSAEPYLFSTLVVPAAAGGADWATYRVGLDREKLARLQHLDRDDFPGVDPVGVPRLAGLQRLYALSSGSGSLAIYKSQEPAPNALMLQYLEEMPRYGWRLDSPATSAANKVAAGVMCFTQGERSSLIWVTPNKQNRTTNITISSR